MMRLLRQPLLHFLIAGALVFWWYQRTDDSTSVEQESGGSAIVVTETELLEYLQYQSQAFASAAFREQLQGMPLEEKQALARRFIEEEVLYREALDRGLDAGDYIIRQRLAEKMEFLLENAAAAELSLTEQGLQDYFAANRTDYQVDAVYDFSHVYFDSRARGADMAREAAEELLGSGQLIGLDTDQAAALGDRYPFLHNYGNRTRDFVINNFDEGFADALDAMAVDASLWSGPVASPYGYHLVQLRARAEPYIPEFDAIRGRVEDDYLFNTIHEGRQTALDELIEDYEVTLELQ